METLVTDAPVVVHESVDGDPDGTVDGEAVNETMQPFPMSKVLEKVPKSRDVQVPLTFSSSTSET